jgi:hypothetical protein
MGEVGGKSFIRSDVTFGIDEHIVREKEAHQSHQLAQKGDHVLQSWRLRRCLTVDDSSVRDLKLMRKYEISSHARRHS